MKILTHIGFIFSIRVSLEPSVPTEYGWDMECSTIKSKHCGAKDLFIMVDVFVRRDANFLAFLLSEKASLNGKVRWSVVNKTMLC